MATNKANLVKILILTLMVLLVVCFTVRTTAHSDTRTLTVTLDSNGGIFPASWPLEESPTRTVDFEIDENDKASYIMANMTPEREGMQFLGWSADKNAEFADWTDKTFYSMADYKTFMPVDGSITTLYAVWTKLYVIELDANGGNYGVNTDRFGKETPIETYTLEIWKNNGGNSYFSVPNAEKEGLIHKGYSADPDAVKPEYGKGFEGLELNDSAPTKLYAIYGEEGDTESDYVAPIPEEYRTDLTNNSNAKIELEYSSHKWTGEALTPMVKVKYKDYYLEEGTEYEVTYSKNVNAGKAKVTVTGVDWFKGTITRTFKITKIKNTLTVKAKPATVRYSKLKKAKQTLAVKKVLKVTKNVGKVTYTKSAGNKKITINKKTGKVTIKKGLKKGTYKVKVKVKAAGDKNYKAMTKTVTLKIKVK